MGHKELLLLSCALGVLCASPALAQDAPPNRAAPARPADRPQPTAPQDGYVIEELIVEGAEHELDIEDAPIAVTTFNAEQRNLTAANTLADMVNLTPGITLSEDGLNIRGIGRQNSETGALGGQNAVAYYVNGFYSVVAGVVGESTIFGGNVQFLRGPQGTLYGKDAIAGASNLLSRRPTKEFMGEGLIQYGDNKFSGVGITVSGPITDRYRFRFGAQHFNSFESVQSNLVPIKAGFSAENMYFEAQLEGEPTDKLHFLLRSTTFMTMNDRGYLSPARYITTGFQGALVPNPAFGYTVPSPTCPRCINVDTKGADRLTGNYVHILNVDYDLGFATLYYVGGYANYKAKGYGDHDRTSRASYVACTPSATVTCAPGTVPGAAVPNGTVIPTAYTNNYLNRNEYFTHELRLTGNNSERLDWTVGLFYYKSNYNERYWEAIPAAAELANPVPLAQFPGATNAPNPDRVSYSQRNILRNQSAAAFGQVTYHVSDEWRLTGGLRFTRDANRATTNIRYIFWPGVGPGLDVTPLNNALFKLANEGTTARLAVEYEPSPDTLFYASYALGYKAGGFNLGNVVSTANNVTDPEKLHAYEVGVKHVFSPTVRGNAAVFYYDYRDMQQRVNAFNELTGAGITRSVNIDKARIYGLELSGTWSPTEALWLNANYSYTNAETVDFCCANDVTTNRPGIPPVFQRLDGKRLPRVPEHKLNLFGTYTINFTPGSLILGGLVAYQSDTFSTMFENPLFRIEERTISNVSATWRSADNQYDLVFQVTNLTDELYTTGFELQGFQGNSVFERADAYGAPRFWQVQLRYRW